nr:MFS transporter [Quadrisphaera setariae]
MSSVQLLRRASPLVRLLVLSQLAFNTGFYLVLPFLAVHLASDLALAAGTVALVLGLRTASQQGLFVVGGVLADRFGPRPLVLTGCAVRVVGFVLLGTTTSATGVIAGALLTGVAAAMFSPAVESELARAAGTPGAGLDRREAFGLFSVAGQVGALAGPVLGSALLLVGFRVTCLVAAAVFVVVLVGHWRLLPRRAGASDRGTGRAGGAGGADDEQRPPLVAGVAAALREPVFLAVALAQAGYLVVYNQLYLTLPLELDRAGVPRDTADVAVGVLFAASAALVVVGQMPVLRWTSHRWTAPTALLVGHGLLVAAVLAGAASRQVGGATAALAGAAALVVLVTAGQVLLMPVGRDVVAALSPARDLGARYGLVSTCGGVAVLLGSWLVGSVVDASDPTGPARALPWLLLASFPLLSAGLVAGVRRHLRSEPAEAPPVDEPPRDDRVTARTDSATREAAGASTAQGARST